MNEKKWYWYLGPLLMIGSLPWTKQNKLSQGKQRLCPSTANVQMLARILPYSCQHIRIACSESSRLNVNTVGAERNPLVAIGVKRLVIIFLIMVISKWVSTILGVSMLWKTNQSNHNTLLWSCRCWLRFDYLPVNIYLWSLA